MEVAVAEAEVWRRSRRGRRVRQAVRLRWSVTRPVSASPEGAGVFVRGQSLCVQELGLLRAISSPGVGGITIAPQEMRVGVVCVFKGLGGDNTVEIQVRPSWNLRWRPVCENSHGFSPSPKI